MKMKKIKFQKEIACMPELKAALRENAGQVAGYTAATAGQVILQSVVVIELLRFISDELGAGKRASVLPYAGAFLAAYLTAAVLKKIRAVLTVCFTRNMSMEIEQDFIRKYSKIRYRNYFFDTDQVLGQARVNGIAAVGTWCTFLTDMIWRVIAFSVSVVYLSSISVWAVAVCIAITAVFMAASRKDNLKLPPLLDQFNGYMAQLYAKQWEQIKNHKIAGFLNLDRAALPYRRLTDRFLADLKKIKVIYNRSGLFASFGTDIVVLVTATLCAILFAAGKLKLSGILALLLSIPNVSGALFALPSLRNSWQESRGGLRMMDEVYGLAGKQEEAKRLEVQKANRVCLEEFSFHYRNQEKNVLDHLNLEMGCGVHLLKGESGCGKSTVLRILAGELPIQGGTLKLGKKEITAQSGVDFGASVEYMSQIPVVIKGTFEENILMGKKMDRQKFEQAVKDADLESVRDNLADGEKTVISEMMLSSGEKQKIALARVFYQEKPVWILDEPTSALDPSAIRRIMRAVGKYAENRVVVMSSHQPVEGVEISVHYFEKKNGEALG